MNTGRIIARLGIMFFFAVLAAGAGAFLQARRYTGGKQQYISLAQIVVASRAANDKEKVGSPDDLGDAMETLVSAEVKLRALERVRALHPEMADQDVLIQAAPTKAQMMFTVSATSSEPRYVRIYLDALLDEFIAYEISMRSQGLVKEVLQQRETVAVCEQQKLQAQSALDKARQTIDPLEVDIETRRLSERLISLRNRRDDLRLELKTESSNATREKLTAVEEELAGIEPQIKGLSIAVTGLRQAESAFAQAETKCSNANANLRTLEQAIQVRQGDRVIQQRASTPHEVVEDWKMPILLGAGGGGLTGALVGLLLSLVIVRPAGKAAV